MWREADARHEQWKTLTAKRAQHARTLEHYAPKGIDALRDEHVQARARASAIDERRAKLPDISGALPLPDAKSAFDTARAQLDNARHAQLGTSEKRALAAANEQSVRERLSATEARLNDAAFVHAREARQSKLIEKDALLKGYARELDECTRKIETAQFADPAADVERYTKSAQNLRDEQARRQT
ncbi:DNA double-strand break repair Rad50 ATPase [Candidatus Burkholderia humilis]|nr:DNA double-strand break repair Rad50 ATPase [Candidatus Burkholderia humilis]